MVGNTNGNHERDTISRQREQLVRERQRLQSIGGSLLAMHRIHITGNFRQALSADYRDCENKNTYPE